MLYRYSAVVAVFVTSVACAEAPHDSAIDMVEARTLRLVEETDDYWPATYG